MIELPDIPLRSTMLPESVGDKGQRYEVRAVSAKTRLEVTLGYTMAASGGSLLRMAARSPLFRSVWIIDREAPCPKKSEADTE